MRNKTEGVCQHCGLAIYWDLDCWMHLGGTESCNSDCKYFVQTYAKPRGKAA